MNDKKMTIGMFTDAFYPMLDGVIMVVDNYARRMAKFANVIVFAPVFPGKNFDDSVLPYKVVRCKAHKLHIVDYSLPLPDFDREFMKEIEKYKLDIVHVHSPATLGRVGVHYAKKHKVPVIGQMHSLMLQDIERAVKIKGIAKVINKVPMTIYNACDACLAVSELTARTYHDIYKYKKEAIVIHNATEMKPIDHEKASKHINKKHNIKEDEKVFLFVGRINALKNIYFIIDALKEFKKNNKDVPFKMIFVGNGQDLETLKKHIKEAELEKDVILAGRIDDREELASYYSRADIFLFPSMYDTSSLVQVEASSQNTPTIFLEGSVTSGTITNNVNGIISKYTKEDYAKNIEKLVKDKDFYKSISEGAKRDLYKTWDDVVEEVFNNYKLLIEQNK